MAKLEDKKAAYLKAKRKNKKKKTDSIPKAQKKKMPQSQHQWSQEESARREKNEVLAPHSNLGVETQKPQRYPVTKKKKKKKY